MASLSKWQIARVSRFCEKHESRERWFYRRLLLKSNRQPWRTRNDLSNDRYRRYACEMRGWDKVRRKIPPSLCRHATKKRITIMRLEMNTMPRDRDTQYSSHLEKFHSNAGGRIVDLSNVDLRFKTWGRKIGRFHDRCMPICSF